MAAAAGEDRPIDDVERDEAPSDEDVQPAPSRIGRAKAAALKAAAAQAAEKKKKRRERNALFTKQASQKRAAKGNQLGDLLPANDKSTTTGTAPAQQRDLKRIRKSDMPDILPHEYLESSESESDSAPDDTSHDHDHGHSQDNQVMLRRGESSTLFGTLMPTGKKTTFSDDDDDDYSVAATTAGASSDVQRNKRGAAVAGLDTLVGRNTVVRLATSSSTGDGKPMMLPPRVEKDSMQRRHMLQAQNRCPKPTAFMASSENLTGSTSAATATQRQKAFFRAKAGATR